VGGARRRRPAGGRATPARAGAAGPARAGAAGAPGRDGPPGRGRGAVGGPFARADPARGRGAGPGRRRSDNRQVAEALFISEKTAGIHVSHILAKLGVSGRVEAAAVAHRLGLAE
jgi:hypothetical protein